MSQMVGWPKPLSAQFTAWVGFLNTRPDMAAMTTPASPIAPGGIGSVATPTMTAAKRAK